MCVSVFIQVSILKDISAEQDKFYSEIHHLCVLHSLYKVRGYRVNWDHRNYKIIQILILQSISGPSKEESVMLIFFYQSPSETQYKKTDTIVFINKYSNKSTPLRRQNTLSKLPLFIFHCVSIPKYAIFCLTHVSLSYYRSQMLG